MNERRKSKLKRMLQESRFRIANVDPELAFPLYDMLFVATKDVEHISTNGECIFFDPDWFQKLGACEMDFIVSHQVMHIVLEHVNRSQFYKGDRFHLAADIVVNANLCSMGWEYDSLPHLGIIFKQTFLSNTYGADLTAYEAFKEVPFDPGAMPPGKRRRFIIDSDVWWDRKDAGKDAGILVLSPDDEEPDDLKLSEYPESNLHLKSRFRIVSPEDKREEKKAPVRPTGTLTELRNMIWKQKQDYDEDFRERVWRKIRKSQMDWRTLLKVSMQREVCDYSFLPPDRRFSDSGFFLPDFNEKKDDPMNVLFFVDTSGSVSDEILSAVYSEIKAAAEQAADGGMIVFFDSGIRKYSAFSKVEDIGDIVPVGGGNTDFSCIGKFVDKYKEHLKIGNIIICTDGIGEIPEEPYAIDIPILWLFTNKHAEAPWGQSVYINE